MEQQKVAQPLLTSPDPGFELHRDETLRSGVARVYSCQVDEAVRGRTRYLIAYTGSYLCYSCP